MNKAGGFAAFTKGVVAIATIYVAAVMIGLEVLTDQKLFVEIAINNPTPLYIQDGLKFIGAACETVLIIVLFKRLSKEGLSKIRVATIFGFLSLILIICNATLSLKVTTQAAGLASTPSDNATDFNSLIGILAMAALFTSGLWYILMSWAALKSGQLPKRLNYLGLTIGAVSLIPILGLIALLLSVVWSFWLSRVLLKDN
jgi:hypothetical protein